MSENREGDAEFMRIALREAVKGAGYVSPNPLVGAVAVKHGKVIAKAFHARYGDAHAEIVLLERLTSSQARGATIYVNLEPCCHHGKTAPCTDALIKAGVARVVIGHEDPNPLVSGKGISQLRRAQTDVSVGMLERECRALNQPFLTYIQCGRPWILLKVAQSLDGRIALSNGQSRWITGRPARQEVHRLRARLDAVLVGAQTVVEDDPELTVRHVRGRDPIRIVLDSNLRVDLRAKLFTHPSPERTWVFTTDGTSDRDRGRVRHTGVELFVGPAGPDGRIDLQWVMKTLAELSVTSVLVEGGGTVHASFIRAQLFDKLIVAAAPLVIGGDGTPAVAELGLTDLAVAPRLVVSRVRNLGDDLWIELDKDVHGNR